MCRSEWTAFGAQSLALWEDAELMGAWPAARNVLGPFKTKSEPEAGGSETPKAA